MKSRIGHFVVMTSLILSGCAGSVGGGGTEEGENVIIRQGKNDNFFSNVAQEYWASSTVEITLEDTYAESTDQEREARARLLMEGKTEQIAWFLHVYLSDKSHDDEQKDYGGMRAMVLDGSFESPSLTVDPNNNLKYTYNFKVQIGGTKELLRLIREDNNLAADQNTFGLQMAKLSNDDVVGFSHGGYGSGDWSPTSHIGDLETVQITIEPIEPSSDGYIDYTAMLSDDIMDVSVHFGWDYHARYDIYHSRNFYTWLVGTMGFTSPVNSYEEYNRLSGPFTKTITVNGRNILMKVTFFRPDPCEAWDEAGPWGAWAQKVEENEDNKKRTCNDWNWGNADANANPTTDAGARNLMKDLKDSLQTRDAIIFTGHSGYTYGYALASWYNTSAGDLDPPEIKTLSLPKDKSQLFVVSGCDTYHVGQAFRENPNKLGLTNADVVTTTSFSNSGDLDDTKDMVKALVGSSSGALSPYTYGRIMKRVNPSTNVPASQFGFFTMYGVHGIDDNPKANPLGDPSKSCAICTSDADCGAIGNVCVRLNNTEKVCAVECVHNSGCAEGQVCQQFGNSSTGYINGMACVPQSLTCGG